MPPGRGPAMVDRFQNHLARIPSEDALKGPGQGLTLIPVLGGLFRYDEFELLPSPWRHPYVKLEIEGATLRLHNLVPSLRFGG